MNIEQRMRTARNLTPTEQSLVNTLLALGERTQRLSIKELAHMSSASIASIHRLCKKLGLEGFKELKVELARVGVAKRREHTAAVDINFPFQANETAKDIAPRMEALYETTLRETRSVLDAGEVDHAAQLICNAQTVDIYTQSHNLFAANMFCERLLSIGVAATCHNSTERLVRCALASNDRHVALAISYSGLAKLYQQLFGILATQACPTVLIGTPAAAQRHPGLDSYLLVSDSESLSRRITQFASHIAVQYVLDTLFSCVFAQNYERNLAFLQRSFPYTRLAELPGTQSTGGAH